MSGLNSLILFCFLLLLSFSALNAQNKNTKGEKYPLLNSDILPNNYFFTKLANDLHILVVEDFDAPMVQMDIAFRGGAAVQTNAFAGTPPVFEKMVFLPNQFFTDFNSLNEFVQQRGMRLQTATERDYARFGLRTPAVFAPDGLGFLSLCLRYPKFDSLELYKSKYNLAKEYQQSETKPIAFLTNSVQKALYNELYLRRLPQADYESTRNVGLMQTKNYYRQYFQPNNALLIFVGQIKHARAFALADSVLSDWKKSEIKPDKSLKISPLEKDTTLIVLNENVETPVVQFAWQWTPKDPRPNDKYTAAIVRNLLTNPNGTFYKRINPKDKPHSLTATFQSNVGDNAFFLTIAPGNVRLNAVIDTILLNIKRWSKISYVSNSELAAAKQLAEVEFRYRNENIYEAAKTLPLGWLGAGWASEDAFVDSLNRISVMDVRYFFERYLEDNPFVLGLLVNSAHLRAYNLEKYLAKRFRSLKPPVVIKPELVDLSLLPRPNLALVQADTLNPTVVDDRSSWLPFQINFNLNQTTIDSISIVALGQVADFLKQNPNAKLWVNGHTDSQGSAEYNASLSLERAQTVYKKLVTEYAVKPDRLKVRGLGQSQLMFPEDTEENKAKNRRVDFNLIKP